MIAGVMKIQRGATAPDPYPIAELAGLELAGADEIDLMDHYEQWSGVVNLCDRLTGATLCQDIASGKIVVTERTPPREPGPFDA
jgi:hypothetical protein